MVLRVRNSVAMVACDAMVDQIDVGAGVSLLQIFSGVKPANLGDAIGAQKKLAEFNLPDPCFGAAVSVTGGGTATADVANIPTATATADAGAGTVATWFRVVDGNGSPIMDGEVTDTAGVGPMKLANTTVVANIDVTIVSWTCFHPE